MPNYESEIGKFVSGGSIAYRGVNMVLDLLSGGPTAAKEYAEFVKANSGRDISDNSCVFTTKGLGYERFYTKLKESGVPCIPILNDKDNTVFVAVPNEYKAIGSSIAQKINAEYVNSPTYVRSYSELKKINKDYLQQIGTPAANNKITVYQNVSKEEMVVVRDLLQGTHVGCRVIERGDGSCNIQVVSGGEKQKMVEKAIIGAKLYISGPHGEIIKKELQDRIYAQKTLQKQFGNLKRGKALFVSDKTNKDVYVIDNNGMYKIAENGKKIEPKPVITRQENGRDKDEYFYRGEIFGVVSKMKDPEILDYSKEEDGLYKDITGQILKQDKIVNALLEESAKYIANTVRDDARNGYVSMAEHGNRLIQILSNGSPDISQSEQQMNELLAVFDSRAIAIGEDQFRMSADELTEIITIAASHPAVIDLPEKELEDIFQSVGGSPDGKVSKDTLDRILSIPGLSLACSDVLERVAKVQRETHENMREVSSATPVADKDRDISRDVDRKQDIELGISSRDDDFIEVD